MIEFNTPNKTVRVEPVHISKEEQCNEQTHARQPTEALPERTTCFNNPFGNTSNESASSSASSSASTKAKTKTVITKSTIKTGKTKSQQHSTRIEHAPLSDLIGKPRQYFVNQLDLRKVALPKTERTKTSLYVLAQRIKASDTSFLRMTRK